MIANMIRVQQAQREKLAAIELEITGIEERLEWLRAEREATVKAIEETVEYIRKLEEELDDDIINE